MSTAFDYRLPSDVCASDALATANFRLRAVHRDAPVHLMLARVVDGAPFRALRAFQRMHPDPGQTQKVRFGHKPRDLGMVSDAGGPLVPEGKCSLSVDGGQSNNGAP